MNTKSMKGITVRHALLAGISATAMIATGALAQDQKASDDTVVVVTGYRASLQTALNVKKSSDIIMDAINADDIGNFPDANLAEALQRIPGISIDRDNGEGRTISVRGLDGGFSRVRINNMEALSTAGANNADGSPNRSRAFDFNTFASELFSSLRVRKSSSAEADEGSLGATVDLITGRPFDFKKDAYSFSLEDSYYENGKIHSPRMTGLFSKRWAGGKLGFLTSVAYAKRNSLDDTYARSGGSPDYTYRGSTWTGNELPGRAGFAAPTGTNFLVMTPTTLTGSALDTYKANPANYYDPFKYNNAAYLEMTGSDPVAYAKLYPNCAAAAATPIQNLTPTSPGCNDSTIRIPALSSLNQRDVRTERLGITTSFQIQFDNDTRLSIDGLFSNFKSESTNYQIGPVGLNRNNTSDLYNFGNKLPTNAATVTTPVALTEADRRGLYPGGCTFSPEDALTSGQDCGQFLYGTTPVAGYTFTFNPNNRDPYEYYTNSASPGYVGPGSTLPFRGDLIGRPAVKVLDAEVVGQNAEYLKLKNIDWRSGADRGRYETNFAQLSFNLTHRFSDKLSSEFSYGLSKSSNDQHGYLVEFNRLDDQGTFIFDARGTDGTDGMPKFDVGFNAADPNNWGIVKGLSAMRHYRFTTDTDYSGAKADFTYHWDDHLTVKFGVTNRDFGFETQNWSRKSDLINPTEKEAGVTVASLGRVLQFGGALDMPAGSTSSFWVPNMEAFSATFGFDCDCINKFGDWRISTKNGRAAYQVTENDFATYAQLDFNYTVWGRRLSGNIGVRQADTEVNAFGQNTAGRPVSDQNKYKDTLPAGNITFEVMDNLYIRAAASKVMARPSLGVLNPAITAISVSSVTGAVSGSTLTLGNTKLKPYRGASYDLAAEWYFKKGSLLSFGVFRKDIISNPQTTFFEAPLSTFLSPEDIASLKLQFPGTTGSDLERKNYIDRDGLFQARQIRDSAGGYLQGWEFSYQQDLDFLPWYFKHLGVQFNMTGLESEFQYLLDPGAVTPGTGVVTKAPVYGTGPWLGASPRSVNFTIYYETEKFSGRVSMANRAKYNTQYPVSVGSCDPGLQSNGSACDAPLINEFGGSQPTSNIDFSLQYKPTKHITVTFEGLNVTNEPATRTQFTDPVVTSYGASGVNYRLGMRYKY
jgi:TonB-dependent receptor